MSRKRHTYESADIVVDFDLKRCIHSAECVRGLPRVFDPARRPWIDPELAPAEEIAPVVERCPTGALHYRRLDGGAAETPDAENVGHVGVDGPLYVRGFLRIELPGGEVLEETRAAFCRCGASRDKPFCDGSHDDAGFSNPGTIEGGRLVPLEEQDAEAVTFSCLINGPLMVRGPLRVVATDGGESAGHKGALCRCGLSGTKPFCDGSHNTGGFQAEGS